jgi:VanZ family protein
VLVLYWLALFTGTHLPSMPAITPKVSDKLLHFCGFFGLAFLLCWVIPTRDKPVRKFVFVALVALSYAAFDEISQGFVRGRVADIRDFAADAAGIFSAIAFYATARKLFPQYSSSPSDEDAMRILIETESIDAEEIVDEIRFAKGSSSNKIRVTSN